MRKRHGELDGVIKKLLEQNAVGAISDDRFCVLPSEYESEQAEIKEKLNANDAAAEEKQQALDNVKRFADIITEYTDIYYQFIGISQHHTVFMLQFKKRVIIHRNLSFSCC